MNLNKLLLFSFLYLSCTTLLGYQKRKKTPQSHEQINQPQVDNNNNIEKAHNPAKAMLEQYEEGEQVPTGIVNAPIRPSTAIDDPDDLIEVNLESTDLPNLLKWISDVFEVNFLTDDALDPLPQGGKKLSANKISFKTHAPLTKKEIWDLFITFLDLFGFGLVEGTIPHFYKVRQNDPKVAGSVTRSPIPSYINIKWQDLPNNDTMIRFVYFVQNSSLAMIKDLVDAFKSTNAVLKPLQDLNAFLLTDKASNIRSIMQVIEELDRITQPEALSVLKLKNADAEDVKKLYDNLTKTEDPRGIARILGTQKKPTSVYFPENLRLIAERRTNTLIILGDAEGIKKVEDFIINHVDTELKIPYSPLYVYDLQYTNAKDIADILTNVTKFASNTPAAQSGGVREGDKYLQPMTFKAEDQGNRLLIKAEKEDYLKVRDIIRKLDVKQPQIAIEVLIINVIAANNKELGAQIRNKDFNTVSKNLDFQNSGLPFAGGVRARPQVDPTGSLMANLVNLASGQTPGSTLLTIANGNGVWAIFKILQSYARTNVVSNPFLVTTNKYAAEVSIGETRRVQTQTVSGERNVFGFGDVDANLSVKITPQINSIGIINLAITVEINNFTDPADPNSANRDTKTVKTNANVGNGEVLAIGGLLQTTEDEQTTKVPILGDIPIVGWLFKNKNKTKTKDNLLVFISPRIIEPRLEGGMNQYSKDKACKAKDSMGEMRLPSEKRDPVHRWFFKDYPCENTEFIDDFIAGRNNEADCYIDCEPCPDEIDPDYVCCKETKRFITKNDDDKNVANIVIAQDENKAEESNTAPVIAQPKDLTNKNNTVVAQNTKTPSHENKKKTQASSITNFLPSSPHEVAT